MLKLLVILLLNLPLLAVASDIPLVTAAVLRQSLLTDSGNTAAEWRALAAAFPDSVKARADGPPHADDPGHSLHVTYDVTLAGSGKQPLELGLQLDMKGFDASDFDHLVFWIKGEPNTTSQPDIEVGFRRAEPGKPDQTQMATYPVGTIGPDWKRISIPLNYLVGIKDWRELAAFIIRIPATGNLPHQGGYFIDELALVKTGKPGPATGDTVLAEQRQAWQDALGGEVQARPKLKARLTGWPTVQQIDPATLPADDTEFLRRLASDTWRGIDALTDRAHGLPLDRVEFQPGSLAPETAHIGDYTNITNIGLHFLAVTAAVELKLISREQALERIRTTLDTLEGLETFRGFHFNYYNTTTLERTSNLISFVDYSWLTAGMIVLRQAFPELKERCTRLISQGNYGFFFDPAEQLMSHGYYINLGLRSAYHYGVFYAESRLGSLIAIGKGEAPREHWFRMSRTFAPEMDWQSGKPLGVEPRSAGGFTWTAGHYHWRDKDFVPSWGGSLFEALMPMLVLDEIQHAPNSLGQNAKVHTELHRRHALEDLGYPVWGMSPSSTPGGNASYTEYGIKMMGIAGYKPGVVTAHAAALALMTEPAEATKNLRKLATEFKAYGDFGLYDAVNPMSREVSWNYLCLNQAMILVALANHLADHAVQKHFAADPIVQHVLPLLKIEQF
jgi:hypothetical protein